LSYVLKKENRVLIYSCQNSFFFISTIC